MICAEPLDDVSTRSLCTTLVPITRVRCALPGGVPVDAGLTAPTRPDSWAITCATGAVVDINNVSSRVKVLRVRQCMVDRSLEPERRTGHDGEVVLGVVRQRGMHP